MVVLHFAGEILVVGAHVHEAVAGEVEEDGLLFAGLFALEGFGNGGGNGVAAFRGRDDTLGAGEEHAGLEGVNLFDINGFHVTVLHELGEDDTGTVVAEATGVDGGRLEGVAQGEHGQERGHAGLVAEVIFEFTLGQFGAGAGLGRDEAGLLAILDVVAHERKGQAAEVGAAAEAGNHDIRIFSSQGHLFLGFQADDRLVQAHVVQHGTQGVLAVGGVHGQLNGFGDGAAQGTLVVGVAGDDVLAGTGAHGRGGRNGGTEGLHDGTAERLLLVADLYHIYGAVNAELLGGIAERTAPLAGTGFGGKVGDSLLLGVVGLGNGGVQLVAAGGRYTFVLEIDVRRGSQSGLQFIGPHQRGAAVGGILLADRLRDGNPFVGLVEFLIGTGLTEDGIEIFGLQRLLGGGVQERQRLVGHDGLDVEIMGRNLGLRKQVLFLFHDVIC